MQDSHDNFNIIFYYRLPVFITFEIVTTLVKWLIHMLSKRNLKLATLSILEAWLKFIQHTTPYRCSKQSIAQANCCENIIKVKQWNNMTKATVGRVFNFCIYCLILIHELKRNSIICRAYVWFPCQVLYGINPLCVCLSTKFCLNTSELLSSQKLHSIKCHQIPTVIRKICYIILEFEMDF